MSFHAHIRKLQGFKKSNLNRYPLENTSCKINADCGNHKPWPAGVCDKCRPSDVTLNRQKYRHVDNISFENDLLVSRFLDFWRLSGFQRIGLLYGYYEQHADVPLGIRAVAAAVYEPQQTDGQASAALNDASFETDKALVDRLAAALGLRPVGWMFTDLAPDERQHNLVKYTRHAKTYFLSAEECITAGYFQSRHPNMTKYCMDGCFGSKFVTVLVTGDSNQQVQLYGYQVSNQCAALAADDCLVPTKDAPELAYARESTPKQYVPTVNYMAKDEYNNEVRKIGRPLPVEYLIVDVPASMPKEPRYTFYANSKVDSFVVENRSIIGQHQDATTVAKYCRQFTDSTLLDMVSDFHFLLYLVKNDTVHFSVEEIAGLCEAVKNKDQDGVRQWTQNSAQWQTFIHLMTSDDHTMQDPQDVKNGQQGWACTHCTFLNQSTSTDCMMCSLPKR